MKNKFYLTRVLMLALSICMILTACTPNSDNQETTDATDEIELATEKLQADLPDDLDFNGETFTFLVTAGFSGYYETLDIYAQEQNGETLNDAVYIRNRNVEEKLNINIAEYKMNEGLYSVSDFVNKSVMAGDNSYDAIFGNVLESASMAQSNLIMNLKEVPHIDLDKPWWDKNAENDLSIKNNLYFTTGDIHTMIKACTRLLIFNKKIVQELELGDPYEYVKNDTWTFDVYAKMVKSAYSDVNGNGEFDDEDMYGTIMEVHNPLYLIMGFGDRMTTRQFDLETICSQVKKR